MRDLLEILFLILVPSALAVIFGAAIFVHNKNLLLAAEQHLVCQAPDMTRLRAQGDWYYDSSRSEWVEKDDDTRTMQIPNDWNCRQTRIQAPPVTPRRARSLQGHP